MGNHGEGKSKDKILNQSQANPEHGIHCVKFKTHGTVGWRENTVAFKKKYIGPKRQVKGPVYEKASWAQTHGETGWRPTFAQGLANFTRRLRRSWMRFSVST